MNYPVHQTITFFFKEMHYQFLLLRFLIGGILGITTHVYVNMYQQIDFAISAYMFSDSRRHTSFCTRRINYLLSVKISRIELLMLLTFQRIGMLCRQNSINQIYYFTSFKTDSM